MKNLIVDPQNNITFLAKVFGNFDYWSPGGLNVVNSLNGDGLLKTYGIEGIYDSKKLDDSYDNVFICYEVDSANRYGYCQIWEKDQDAVIQDKKNHISHIYDILSNLKYNKLFFFDAADKPLTKKGEDFLIENNFHYDLIFKREYRRTHMQEYSPKVKPFPFLAFGQINPVWVLLNDTLKAEPEINKCFWAGAHLNFNRSGHEDEWVNRQSMIRDIYSSELNLNTGNLLSEYSGLNFEDYIKTLSNHKFCLHLNGTGNLCRRFFEGLYSNSLLMIQNMDVVFPFESGDWFSKDCTFQFAEEFVRKLNILSEDERLYEKCLAKQSYIKNKYYKKEWIKSYILNEN